MASSIHELIYSSVCKFGFKNWSLSFAFFLFFGLRNTSFLVKNDIIDSFYMFVLEQPVDSNSKMILLTKIPEHLLIF